MIRLLMLSLLLSLPLSGHAAEACPPLLDHTFPRLQDGIFPRRNVAAERDSP